MAINSRAKRLMAAVLSLCMLGSGFGRRGVALATQVNDKVVRADGNMTNLPDPVTLLSGNGEIGVKGDLEATIQQYQNTYALGVAADFCVFLEKDFWITQSDAEGRVAVGRNLYADCPWDFNYTIGAGDFWWHTPLDELLVRSTGSKDTEGKPDRIGAATVIIGGELYGKLNDTYYEYDGDTVSDVVKKPDGSDFKPNETGKGDGNGKTPEPAWRRKYEGETWDQYSRHDNHNNVVKNIAHASSKILVFNQTPAVFNADSNKYLGTHSISASESYWKNDRSSVSVDEGYIGGWRKVSLSQTYAAYLIDFEASFAHLRNVTKSLAAEDDEFTVTTDGDAVILTYNGDKNVARDCVYLTLDGKEFAQFRDATYVKFENIPNLPESRQIVEVQKRDNPQNGESMDDVYLKTWTAAYIVVNIPGDGSFTIANIDKHNGQKFTSINGSFISRNGTSDNDMSKNNDAGVTSILYSFPEAKKVILGNNFQGTILAPNADVTDAFTEKNLGGTGYDDAEKRGHLSGALIAKSFKGATEFGYRPFTGPSLLAFGGLSVTKTVTGTGADTSKKFNFQVKLSDSDISGTYGDMTFNKGIAAFELAHGETKRAMGLPAGVTYEAIEEDSEEYTATAAGNKGAIGSGKVAQVEFVNAVTGTKTVAHTGDGFTPELWFGLMAVALGGLCLVSAARRRRVN